MKHIYMRKLKFSLVFTAFIFCGISKVFAQPANFPPVIKYALNNYSTIAKAVDDCDTCLPLVGKPLRTFRPIPFPLSAAANLIPGVDINEIPGIAAPNFWGGGSPEIKGLVKEVAGMTDWYAKSIAGRSEVLYFRGGAQGVAVSKTGKIFTSSLTTPAGAGRTDINPKRVHGFFSFKSEPTILPKFNNTSEAIFTPSPETVLFQDVPRNNSDKEVVHFALHPENENIVYAALQNEVNLSKRLVRKNRAGDWVELERYIPGGLSMPQVVWGALAVDKDGNLYVADDTHHVIVKVTFDDNGKVTSWRIIAGKMDTPGFANDGDNDDSLESRFNKPSGICIDLAGNIYIGDAGNNLIRKIDTDGDVTTYAGTEGEDGKPGEAGTTDDKDWNDAKFDGPTAVAYNEKTKTLYVVDFNRKTIREINDNRNVSTVAGLAGSANPITDPKGFAMNFYYVLAKLNMDPDEAKFTSPTGIAIDPSGFGLYVSDGNYIKYVNTSETIFTITHAFGDPKANFLGLPQLPYGITMNKNNGSFAGFATTPWEPTTYTISVTNHVVGLGLVNVVPNGAITFEVVNCPDIPDTVYVNQTIHRNQLPYTWNNKVIYQEGTTVVKLPGLYGCDSLVKLNLMLSAELAYSTEPYILSVGQQIKPIVPKTGGSLIDTFSVTPPLPDGLLLNGKTGEITGIPLATTSSQTNPAVGPQTPPQYPAPWPLEGDRGADLTEFKISDGNGKTVFENNSAFKSLVGTAGQGTGSIGAYTDFSALGSIKMFSNSPYSLRLTNTLFTPEKPWESVNYTRSAREEFNFMNSYAVYIDYNRDGDFADGGERVYISGAPQNGAHVETFALNIPLSAKPGVTKMRIYAVEARTDYNYYLLDDGKGGYNDVWRSTEQALSFYPFYNNIASDGATQFTYWMNFGEFEDYNIDIISPVTESYVVTGSNAVGSAQSTVKIAVNRPTSSSTDITICDGQFPYKWNSLIFTQAGTKTDTLRNVMGADSLAMLNLSVKLDTRYQMSVEHCGTYNFNGQFITTSGYYRADLKNVAGCDSTVYLTFRQKATASTSAVQITPGQLPYAWRGMEINNAGTYYDTLENKENCDSIITLKLLVQYNITYTTNNLLTLNKTITPLHPQIQGGYVPPGSDYSYSISPALPPGLSLNPGTGVISGTPADVSPLNTYTITLNQEGAQPASFTLSVGAPSFSTTTIDNCGPLTWNEVVYDRAGTFIAPLKNRYGYDSTATLILTIRNLSASTTDLFLKPSQLPFTWNDTSITKEGLHTVHLVNAVGCDSAATAVVVISPEISYVSPQILHPNQTIAAITPQHLGGNATSYTIEPALVRGLQMNEATGVISGTPADTLLQPVTYTIHAYNGAGSDTTTIVVAVCNTMATSFTVSACDQYIWNDSTYTGSTTHLRTFKNRGGCDSVVTMNLMIKKSSKGRTDSVTACVNYVWYGVKYDTTGFYTKVYPNTVGCDSTIYLNLTIKNPTENNLYVNLNASDFPYTWRGKTFRTPGTDSVMRVNSVGCDSTVWMTVRISNVLPDISYAVKDTILYWEQTIETPITMTNAGTPVPAMKLGERDTLIKFSNGGPGDHLRNIVKGPDGAYYASIAYQNKIFKLNSSGAWTEFADLGGSIAGMAMDTAGNLYAGVGLGVKKITPGRDISTVNGLPRFADGDALAVDGDNNLIVADRNIDKQLTITKLNLSTGSQVGQIIMDHSPYFDYGEIDMEADSKGTIYLSQRMGTVILKIKPNGHISSVGQQGTEFSVFKPGNGIDAVIPEVLSMAIDRTNDNVYLMARRQLLRVDTAENVTAITGSWFEQWKDHIFRVDSGKASIINNTTAILYTANIHGVGSFPFMDNYGVSGVDIYGATVNFTDFDKRIRLDSSGSIVGTPRSNYSSIGTMYGSNRATAYSIIASNHHGVSTAPMVITTKNVYYKRESFVTTTLPFIWRGRSFSASTDTATYFVANKLEASDTIYRLHLVYEAPPVPFITSTCVTGGVSLAATGAAKSAISFDGTNMGVIQNTERSSCCGLGYYGADWTTKPDGSTIVYFQAAFEVWIKPASVSGTQYLLTRDTVKTNGTFFGYSIQDGKFVYEFTKGAAPFVDYKLISESNIEPNVWTHVAASYYDSAMHIFINGKLEGKLQTADRFMNLWYNEPGTYVGIFPDFYLAGLPGKFGYKGEMDELRLFSTRRNADSIKATMNTILDPKRGGLGLYYRFDGDITNGVPDVSLSGRTANFIKPATSVTTSGAPINFASYNWTPGDSTTKSVIAKPTTSTTYKVTVKDYKGTSASASLLVYPAQAPAITAPAAIAKSNSPASCTVVVSDTELGSAIATDNCPGLLVNTTGVPAGNAFPVGVTTITYTATSINGLTKSATQTVTITDVSKPAFTIGLTAPLVVWPPDHRLKPVALTYTTADLCGTVTNKVTVTSTDPITGVSDGDISPDWVITNDHLVQLRAERGNGKEARIYTITVTPVDQYGNVGIAQSTKVTIAHNITGPITGTAFKIGSTVNFSGVFWDKQGNKHTGEWVIDDNTLVKGVVTEPSGTKNGKLTGSYKFTTAGTYKLRMNITDQNKVTSYCNTNEDMEAIVVIYDPAGGYTYGGGWFSSPAGALKSDATATGKANFGYAVSYFKGAANPKGETQFELKVGDFEYNALNFEYLSVAGARAQIKGTGRITGGQSGINFVMTVIDGAIDRTGIDKVRIKIYNKNTGQVYYDNEQGSDANNPVTKVGTNSQLVIGGTNVTTGSSVPVATRATTPVAPTELAATLQVRAFPNPSQHQFTLIVKGRNNEPVSIRVMDVTGRVVEERKAVAANGTLTLGSSYRPGLYIVEVLQGKEKLILKLVKE